MSSQKDQHDACARTAGGLRSAVVDLSHHQRAVDFRVLRHLGVQAVIHKASQGAGYADPRYRTRRNLAASQNLLWGAYHFGTGDAVAGQVNNFLAQVSGHEGALLVLDVEPNPGGTSMSLAQAEEWVLEVRERTGRPVVVYGGGDYLRDSLQPPADSPLGQGGLWWARWGSDPGQHLPAPWAAWSLWQHTDGQFGGAPMGCPEATAGEPCDRSAHRGEAADLAAWWAAGGLPGAVAP